jgi:Helix-turn-helix of DDE superfamily endonuclease
MISYKKLAQKPVIFQSFTGLKLAAFTELLPAFEQAYEIDLDRRDARRKAERHRQRGGGRTGALPLIEDKLVFILVYFRFYPVQVLQGYLFDLSQPQANDWIHRLSPILNEALGIQQQLPARRAKDIETILSACPGLEFIIDGTERPIRRPKDPEKQKQNYSGKKHDKKLADEQQLRFPPDSKLWQDTGFQGYEPEHTQIFQPKKNQKDAS